MIVFGAENDSGKWRFLGIDGQQHSDFSVTLENGKYAEKIIREFGNTEIGNKVTSETPLSPEQLNMMRKIVGELAWSAISCAPTLLAAVSRHSSKVPLSISRDDEALAPAWSDASLGNIPPNTEAQAGHTIWTGLEKGFINPLNFTSHKLRRITRSTFASEVSALVEALDDLTYMLNRLDFLCVLRATRDCSESQQKPNRCAMGKLL